MDTVAEYEPVLLWIDAICINHADLREWSEQNMEVNDCRKSYVYRGFL